MILVIHLANVLPRVSLKHSLVGTLARKVLYTLNNKVDQKGTITINTDSTGRIYINYIKFNYLNLQTLADKTSKLTSTFVKPIDLGL